MWVLRTATGQRAHQQPQEPSVRSLCRYDVEMVQRIEALVGLKLELYPTEQESVLVLAERVNEAQRIATMQMKEADSKRKGGGGAGGKRKGAADDAEDPTMGKAFRSKKY